MAIEAIYPRRSLSRTDNTKVIYPYLLRGLEIRYSDQVWCSDITYIRLKRGYAYLVVVMDWYSRYVISWGLSITLDSGFCVEAVKKAILRPSNSGHGHFVEVKLSALAEGIKFKRGSV